MSRLLLVFLLVLPGMAGVVVFGYYALVDWDKLIVAYRQFEQVSPAADLPTLFKAEAQQNIHRINLFAEGVWFLLSAIIVAIGLHGFAIAPRR
jgi:hypothetical protein